MDSIWAGIVGSADRVQFNHGNTNEVFDFTATDDGLGTPSASIPEPGTFAMMAAGLAALARRRRRASS